MSETPGSETPGSERRTRRIGLPTLLAVAFGSLTTMAVLAVLGVALFEATRNTAVLLRDRAELTMATMVERIEAMSEPVRVQLDYLAHAVESGRLDPSDPEQLSQVMLGALSATPQVDALALIRPDLTGLRVDRADGKPAREDWHKIKDVATAMAVARTTTGISWVPPFWSRALGGAAVAMRVPLRRGDRFFGVLVAPIRTTELSEFLQQRRLGVDFTPFILYGQDAVLAHPNLARAPGGTPVTNKHLPASASATWPLDAVGDPILAAIWTGERRTLRGVAPLRTAAAHAIVLNGTRQLFIYREIARPGGDPWLIGVHAPAAEAARELGRLAQMAVAGLVMLLVAVLATIWVGRRIARPVVGFAAAARRVAALDIERPPTLRRSRIREFDDAVRAFNAMVTGLRWLETYVPKTLVRGLIAQGYTREARSEDRVVTVMSTDIIGFSAIAERRSAAEVAEFLNAHFALVGGCVEATGGTIDKYIGDVMMAFWGAPVDQPDAAVRACRAAAAIAHALRFQNARNREAGLAPVRLRIGLHQGRAIVGNIGLPGRINYTLVGDTVNVAQRLEQLGKEYDDGADAIVLASADVLEHAGDGLEVVDLGYWTLRGREGGTPVRRLLAADGSRGIAESLFSVDVPSADAPSGRAP